MPGTSHPHPRAREPPRLRRLLVRPRRRRRDRRPRAGLPGDRGRRAEDAPQRPRAGARARPRRRRRPSGGRCSRRSASRCARTRSSAIHRPRSLPEAEVGRIAARVRRAARPPAGARCARAAARERASAQPLGAPGELVARYRDVAPVHAHRRTRSARWARSTPISTARSRCSDSFRATSDRARPSSRCTRSCARSRPGDRER